MVDATVMHGLHNSSKAGRKGRSNDVEDEGRCVMRELTLRFTEQDIP